MTKRWVMRLVIAELCPTQWLNYCAPWDYTGVSLVIQTVRACWGTVWFSQRWTRITGNRAVIFCLGLRQPSFTKAHCVYDGLFSTLNHNSAGYIGSHLATVVSLHHTERLFLWTGQRGWWAAQETVEWRWAEQGEYAQELSIVRADLLHVSLHVRTSLLV